MSNLLLKVLSEPEVEELHNKTLEVLDKVGFKVLDEESLKRFKQAGALVDEHSGLIKVPPQLFDELMKQASPVSRETGLNGKWIEAGGDNQHLLSLIIDPFIADYDSGLRRPVLEDVRKHTIIGESLEQVDAMMRMQYPVSDIPEPDCYLKTMEVFLCNCTKHIAIYPTSEENFNEWLEILDIVRDTAGLSTRTPLASIAVAVTSPLVVHKLNVEILKKSIEKGYPVIPTVCPMAGTTSPYTVLGTCLVANVESLIPILLTQLYHPGHPSYFGYGPSASDMHSGHDLYYKAEKFLFKVVAAQMGKYYGVPIIGEAGGTLTYQHDVQNGAESILFLLASYASGQNRIGGLGSLHNANGMSAEQIIVQCGLAEMAEYVSRGIDFCDYKMAFDSILNVGPGGNFLADSVTVEMLRSKEFFDSSYFDMTGGYVDNPDSMYKIAHEKAEELISNYERKVPDKVVAAIKDFFKDRYQDKKIADI